jgi:hypothetical protein
MSEILDMVVATLTDATAKANKVADEILAATTDRTKMVHEIRTAEDTDDEKIKAFQQWYEAANAKIEEQVAAIDEYIKAEKLGTSLDEAALNAKREEYKGLKTQVTSAVNFAKTVPGFTEETLKAVPELKSLRGGTSGGGTGGKRPRVERISFAASADGPWTEVDKDGKTNFTLLAQRLSKDSGTKVEVKDLQAAAFEAAGTDDLSSLEGKVFTFSHSVGTGDKAKNVFVKVQPAVKGDESEDKPAETTPAEDAPAAE